MQNLLESYRYSATPPMVAMTLVKGSSTEAIALESQPLPLAYQGGESVVFPLVTFIVTPPVAIDLCCTRSTWINVV